MVLALLLPCLCADACVRVPSRPATEPELLAVHTPDHLRRLVAHCTGADTSCRLPSDTYVNEHTLSCALLAAGSAAEAAVQVARGAASCAAAIIRPPGGVGGAQQQQPGGLCKAPADACKNVVCCQVRRAVGSTAAAAIKAHM